ncbi:MAG TPA: gephyrin-like molybdotransferase Glp [Terriglobales bacterium]|nr:gephyrin-like molybdotransferase Glp [Terriglobales bacterium]
MPSASVPTVLSFEQARHLVELHAAGVAARDIEAVDLLAAVGRVLAEQILADRDFPPFPRATRDGFAVRAADLVEIPARLMVVGEVKAGDWPEASGLAVGRGQAVSIMTGAPLPAGADAVVMVEFTTCTSEAHPNVAKDATLGWGTLGSLDSVDTTFVEPTFIEVQRSVQVGENFVPRGAEARAGQVLLERGRRLDHAAVAIAASVGKSKVQVFRKPRVAVLATGDELVEIDAAPAAAQIRNSNTYSLAAQVEEAGGVAVRLAIAPDERERLRMLIEEGLKCDLLLLAGGVSTGKFDLVEQVLGELGAEFYFTGAEIQPGRPVVFGSCGLEHRKYFLGLPGNPVSTMVTFELFARPMIEALAGLAQPPLIFLRAQLKSEIRTKTGLKRFLPGVLSGEFENAEVELARWQGSGDLAALGGANCYVVIPADRERIGAGEWVAVLRR